MAYPPGEAVQGFAVSFANKWEVSYRISARAPPLSYKLVYCAAGDKCCRIHIDDLKRFFSPLEDLGFSQVSATADRGSWPVTLSSPSVSLQSSVTTLMDLGDRYLVLF